MSTGRRQDGDGDGATIPASTSPLAGMAPPDANQDEPSPVSQPASLAVATVTLCFVHPNTHIRGQGFFSKANE